MYLEYPEILYRENISFQRNPPKIRIENSFRKRKLEVLSATQSEKCSSFAWEIEI